MKTYLLKKVVMVTKFTLIGALLQCVFLNMLPASATLGQTESVREANISWEYRNIKILEAFRLIEQKTNYRFLYHYSDIDKDLSVRTSLKRGTVADLLMQISAQTNLKFRQVNNNINVSLKDDEAAKEGIIEVFIQGSTVTGKVVSGEDGQGLPGANVVIKGSSVGTVTDVDGNYSIEITSSDAVLVFSSVGFKMQEAAVGNRTVVDVTLSPDVKALEEIVVVGYGTQKKSDLTGAVTSVKAEDIQKAPSANVVSSLQGQAAGVYITQSSGQPGGSGLNVQIRGLKSLTASNEPLYVIDGLPLTSSSNVMGELNPNDIASIEILKDASAASIYGSRGANGVVLITTKRGQEGRMRVNYDAYAGPAEITRRLDLFSGPEWLELKREAHRADGLGTEDADLLDPTQLEVVSSGEWVDWQNEIFREGFQQSHNLSISGGSEQLRMNLSLGYYNEKGIYHRSDYERGSIRLNMDYKPTEKLQFSANMQAARTSEDLAGSGAGLVDDDVPSASGLSVLQSPAAKLRDEEGNLTLFVNDERVIFNPLFLVQESLNDRFRSRIISSISGRYEFLPGLSYKLNTGIEYQGLKLGRYQTRAYNDGGKNMASVSYGEGFNYTIENILNYAKEIAAGHQIDATFLYSVQENRIDTVTTASRDLPGDLLGYNVVHQGTEALTPERGLDEWQLESYMGRLRYNLLDKYLLTLTARLDGSSKFGSGNRYGFFPSAAVAWKLDQESFMRSLRFMDQLKLRLSYGEIGNQEIASFQSIPRARIYRYSFGGTVVAGFNSESLPNANLKWETTKQFNLGLDFGFLEGRIDGSFEYYRSNIEDLLLTRSISSANGFTSIIDNIGETKNHGVELNLIARVLRINDFQWTVSGNWAAERSEIVATSFFDEEGNPLDDVGNKWFIGEPIAVNYDYVFDGIWQTNDDFSLDPESEPGDIKVRDLDGDGQITATGDRAIIGTPQPDWYGGLTNTFSYKGFDLSVFLVTRQGVQRLNNQLDRGLQGRFNHLRVDYWTPENPSNTYHRPHRNEEFPRFRESMHYQDASYTALKSLSLAYNFSSGALERVGLSSLRFYVTGSNLKYWTDFDSYNPESEFDAYPSVRSWIFGVNVGI